MENVVMIKDGKYNNIRLFDAIFSFAELNFHCNDIIKVDESIIVGYILKHMNDDVLNFIHLAANIAVYMEKDGLIADTQKIREYIVKIEMLKMYSENEYERILINFVDFSKRVQDIDDDRNIKIQKNVIDYFENQLLINILTQYIKIIFSHSSHLSVKKIKITTKTSDLLYDICKYDSLDKLKEDIVNYFASYHKLVKMLEVSKFEDYLIITLKHPFFN